MKRGRLLREKKGPCQECPGAEHIGWIHPNHFPSIPNHFIYNSNNFMGFSIYFPISTYLFVDFCIFLYTFTYIYLFLSSHRGPWVIYGGPGQSCLPSRGEALMDDGVRAAKWPPGATDNDTATRKKYAKIKEQIYGNREIYGKLI